MPKAVLLSVQPKWCELIASGKKTVEVRKTRPEIDTPFKCYIYCTNGKPYLNWHNGLIYLEPKDTLGGRGVGLYKRLSGMVIGEFVCDTIITDRTFGHDALFKAAACMSDAEIATYCVNPKMYGWHISNLIIYDKPKELSEFYKEDFEEIYSNWEDLFTIGVPSGCPTQYPPEPKKEDYIVKRPPQSWCYVEVNAE